MPSPANKLTSDILQALYKRGVFAWRSSTTGIPTPAGWRTAPKKGVSDILAVLPPTGSLLAIEIKIGTDRLSPEQTGFLQNVRTMGGHTCVVHDIKEFETCWQSVV